jgi:hypothetical protein
MTSAYQVQCKILDLSSTWPDATPIHIAGTIAAWVIEGHRSGIWMAWAFLILWAGVLEERYWLLVYLCSFIKINWNWSIQTHLNTPWTWTRHKVQFWDGPVQGSSQDAELNLCLVLCLKN